MKKISDANEAVLIAAGKSIEASLQNTFAVGGALIENQNARLICALHNNVLEPFENRKFFLLHDPTAHAERQLVDWYFENRELLKLPAPKELTIVTTLEPCAMCAGALLIGGFNVAISATDNYAGINYNESFDFRSLPANLRPAARSSFAYYGVESPVSRPFRGGHKIIFADQRLRASTYYLTDTIFESSVNAVRSLDNNSGNNPTKLRDPKDLPRTSRVKRAFLDAYPGAFSVKCSTPRIPGKEIGRALVDTAKGAAERGAAFNSVAFLDPFGNLLLCIGGAENFSPIRTAFMELTRTYAHIRWLLMNDRDPSVRDQASNALTHPKYGTFVFLYLPDPKTPQGVMTLGAYGSTMEGPIPQSFPSNLQYVLLPADATQVAVAELATNLPPFYTTDVQVAPVQVLNCELIKEIDRLLPNT